MYSSMSREPRAPVLLLAIAAALAVAPAVARAQPRTLQVAAAANLKPALEALAASFAARTADARVQATYGASGTFFAQIRNGAPFDLFLSADAELPRRLVEAGQGDGGAFTYALGRLVVWVPRESRLDLARGLEVVADPSVRKIAIANPAVAPYGAAAEAALRGAGLHDRVRQKLVLGQNVQQAAQFAESGNAQVALLPLSLAAAPPLADGRRVLVPLDAHPPIEQAGVVLAGARERALAHAFTAFLLGPDGRAVLERSGYALPSPR